MHKNGKIKVIYIGGAEHSGSTILGVALGNHPKIECIGELSSLAREGWLEDYTCACGEGINRCSFWNGIKSMYQGSIQQLVNFELVYDRNRSFPKVNFEKFIKTKQFQAYQNSTLELLYAIQRISNKPIILDTSKRYSRALALSMNNKIDLRIIHLVRDPRGVAYSWAKRKYPRHRNWANSSIQWITTNLAFEFISKTQGDHKVIRLRYEDFIENPKEIINKIGHFCDIDMRTLADDVAKGKKLIKGHFGIGNGFLKNHQDIKVQSTVEWPKKFPINAQRKVWYLTQFMMRWYEYVPE